jgi:hypothetical protein
MNDLTLNILLSRIKDEADRLLAAETGLDREAAYQKAIVSVVMTTAEEQAVTSFEAWLLDRLDQAVRRSRNADVGDAKLSKVDGFDIDGSTLLQACNQSLSGHRVYDGVTERHQ